MVAVAASNGSYLTSNGAVPCEGTKAYPFLLDFAANNAYKIDLTQQWQQKQFVTLQTAWVDNKDNTQPLTLICSTTSQRIVCPPLSQGFYALLQPTPPVLQVESDGGITVEIILLNFYIPPQIWLDTPTNADGLPEVDVPALDGVIQGGKVLVQGDPATLTGLSDFSDVIAAGGTPQQVLPNDASRIRFIIANPDTASETLYMRFGANNAGPIPLQPGMIWDESGTTVVGQSVWLSAATTGHPFTAYSGDN